MVQSKGKNMFTLILYTIIVILLLDVSGILLTKKSNF